MGIIHFHTHASTKGAISKWNHLMSDFTR